MAAKVAAGKMTVEESAMAALANAQMTHNVPIVPPSPFRDNAYVLDLDRLARGARKRVLLNMSNSNPVTLHVNAIQFEPQREPSERVSSKLDECLGVCEDKRPGEEHADGTLEVNRQRARPSDIGECCVPVKLEWTLQLIQNELRLPMRPAGTKKLWETSTVDEYEPAPPWEPSMATEPPPALIAIPPKCRILLAVDVIAQRAGVVGGHLVLHLQMQPPLGRPTAEQRVGLVGEAIEGDLVYVKTWGHQNETTHVEGTPGHVADDGTKVRARKRRRYGTDLHTYLDFRVSAPGTTRELPVIVYSAFYEPQHVTKLSASLWWRPSAAVAMQGTPTPSLSVTVGSTADHSLLIAPRTRSIVGWARLSTEQVRAAAWERASLLRRRWKPQPLDAHGLPVALADGPTAAAARVGSLCVIPSLHADCLPRCMLIASLIACKRWSLCVIPVRL